MFAAATVFAYGCSDNFDDSALWKDIDGVPISVELKQQIFHELFEKEKKVIVIRPDNTDGFSRLEKDKEKIKALYHDGYTKGLLFSDKVKEFYTK